MFFKKKEIEKAPDGRPQTLKTHIYNSPVVTDYSACPYCLSKQFRWNVTQGVFRCLRHRCARTFEKPTETGLKKRTYRHRKKRRVQNIDILHHAHVVHLIKNMRPWFKPGYPHELLVRDRAFLSVLYLSAARISEIVRSERVSRLYKAEGKPWCEPMKKFDFSFELRDGRQWLVLQNVRCLKHRKIRHYRNIPIPVDDEPDLVGFIKEWLDMLPMDDSFVFDFKERHGRYLVTKYLNDEKVFPHLLRHIRFTHLVTKYNFNSEELRHYAGWTNSVMASAYVDLNWQDLCSKLSKSI